MGSEILFSAVMHKNNMGNVAKICAKHFRSWLKWVHSKFFLYKLQGCVWDLIHVSGHFNQSEKYFLGGGTPPQ